MIIDDALRSFLGTQRVARLATVDADSRPHIVPICFALEGDVLYTAIDEKPKRDDYARLARLRNIARNPQVQVLVDVYDDDEWSRLKYVQLRGVGRVIESGAEHDRAAALLRSRYRQYLSMALDVRPIIAIDVQRVVGWQAQA